MVSRTVLCGPVVILLFARITLAGADGVTAYVKDVTGEWRDGSRRLKPLSVLHDDSKLELNGNGEITIRFLNGLCDQPGPCGGGGACRFAIKDLKPLCPVPSGSALNALMAAFKGFFRSAHSDDPGQALTLSRAGGDDDDGEGPVLQEAVLLVENGRIEFAPLFKTAVNGSFSLQLCDPGPQLTNNCSESSPDERVAVRIANGQAQPAEFSKPDGLYRVRLWRMTPRGPQPTEKGAIVLIGAKSALTEKQQKFREISSAVAERASTDAMIRLMLASWLAQNAKGTAP